MVHVFYEILRYLSPSPDPPESFDRTFHYLCWSALFLRNMKFYSNLEQSMSYKYIYKYIYKGYLFRCPLLNRRVSAHVCGLYGQMVMSVGLENRTRMSVNR